MNSTDEANSISAEALAQLEGAQSEGAQPEGAPSKGSRLISRVLSPAIQLWLRAQVEAITGLRFQIQGSDREILRGCVARVEVQAAQMIYQGLHLSQVALSASQIQINLGQVLQGKPLRLLEAVPVVGTVRLDQADLHASINAPLLHQALADFLTLVLHHLTPELPPDLATQLAALQPMQLEQPKIQLAPDRLTLSADLLLPRLWPHHQQAQRAQLILETQLQLTHGSHLQFAPLKIRYTAPFQQPVDIASRQPLVIDLGSEVHLQKLEITAAGVVCEGRINVTSAG